VTGFTFFLGTHQPAWLAQSDIPMFVSRARLARLKRLPRARAPWALDSGAFTQVAREGGWTFTPAQYVAEVRRYRDEIGSLQWAAPMDWVCEPEARARTGLTVREHQRRTIENFIELRSLDPSLPFVPAVQGWTLGDFIGHVEGYASAGIDLRALPLVVLGSVCRRQQTTRAALLIRWLAAEGLKIHALGFKRMGLPYVADVLVSADSLAWSLNARRSPPLPECKHARCSNCIAYALEWRSGLLAKLARSKQAA
jgi:hypothetical protein